MKGLWWRYHVAGFCCRWGFKRTASPCWSPSSGLSRDLFLFLNFHLLSRRLGCTLTSWLRYYCTLKRAVQLPAWSHACNLSLEITLTCEFYSGALPVVLRAWSHICEDRVMWASETFKLRRNLKVSCLSGTFDEIVDIILILSIFYLYNLKLLKLILSIMDSKVFVLITSLIASKLVMPQVISTVSLSFILVCSAFVAHVYLFLSERPYCSLYFPFYSCFRYTAASSDVSFFLDAASFSYGAENQTSVLKSNKYQTKVPDGSSMYIPFRRTCVWIC